MTAHVTAVSLEAEATSLGTGGPQKHRQGRGSSSETGEGPHPADSQQHECQILNFETEERLVIALGH